MRRALSYSFPKRLKRSAMQARQEYRGLRRLHPEAYCRREYTEMLLKLQDKTFHMPKSLEYLETAGVPVITYGADEFPAFYSRRSGFAAECRMDDPAAIAALINTKEKMGLKGEDCLMIGNDGVEDVAAMQCGMQVFLITDCLLNGDKADLEKIPHGSFEDAIPFVNAL